MPKGGSNKSMFGGAGLNTYIISEYIAKINANTVTKANVKNVEDIQKLVGYFNHVIGDIEDKKKKI